jgi:hypothetical protein
MLGFKGIAGEDIEPFQAVYRGADGKFYLASGQGEHGIAVEKIAKGEEFSDDNYNGRFRPVKK